MTRDARRARGLSLGDIPQPERMTTMTTSKLLKAFALDLCAAAIGVSIIAVPMLFIGTMA